MKTIERCADAFLELTTDNYKGNGEIAVYQLTNGITLNAVKLIMQENGFYTDTMEDKELLADILDDWNNKFLRKREYSNYYAKQTRQTQHFTVSVKGCKLIYEYLTNKVQA